MSRTIVIEFLTLDGVVDDPDGSGGTPSGGWAFRHGPDTIAGDKFQLGAALNDGIMVLGHNTWKQFSRIWPNRDDDFSRRMNAIPKLVLSRSTTDFADWANSTHLDGDLGEVVRRTSEERDVIIAGSISVVHALMAADLIDEYRLLIFPTIAGTGRHLFPNGAAHANLRTVTAEPSGAAVLVRFERDA